MPEKRYTVIFEAKDRISARMDDLESRSRSLSRELGILSKSTSIASMGGERLRGSYSSVSGTIKNTDISLSRLSDTLRHNNSETHRSTGLLSDMESGLGRVGRIGSNTLSGLSTGLGSLVGVLGSIGAAATTAGIAIGGMAAKGLWDHIVQPAMDIETNKIQIGALAGSPKLGKEIYGMANKFGRNSMYDNDQVMKGTFSFMQNTKDPAKLKEILSITERLAVLNKDEGFLGASFSMKEAMSGDIQSMAERFNVAKKDLRSNGFDSNADWQTNLSAVDTTLSKMNVDDDLINKIQDSTPARFDKLKKDTRLAFADMGGGILSEMRPALIELNNLFADQKGLATFSKTMSEKLGEAARDVFGLGDGVNITWKNITDWSVSTFNGVSDVITSLGGTFTSTMELLSGEDLSGPKEAFQSFGKVLSRISSVIDTINGGIKAMKKASDWSDSYFEGISNMNETIYGDSRYGLLTGWAKPIVDKFSGDDGSHALGLSYVPRDNYKANLHEGERVLTRQENIRYSKIMQEPKMDGSHANGISYIPKNDYKANLHEGERVLTRQENQAYASNNQTIRSGNVTINVSNLNVRNQSDIEEIGELLFRRISSVV